MVLLERNLYGHLWQNQYGRGNSRNLSLNTVEKNSQIANAYSLTKKKGYSCFWLERNRTQTQCWKYSWKTLIWTNRHHSSTTFIWVAVNENVERAKKLWTITGACLYPESLQEQKKNTLIRGIWRKHSPWSCNIDGRSCIEMCGAILWTGEQHNPATVQSYNSMHALMTINSKKKNCQECWSQRKTYRPELQGNLMQKQYLLGLMTWRGREEMCGKVLWICNKTTQQIYEVATPCMDDQLETCLQFAHKFYRNVCVWLVLVVLIFLWYHFSRTLVRIWKSQLCTNKLDEQETNFCFTQFYTSWNPFSRCRFTNGWNSRS